LELEELKLEKEVSPGAKTLISMHFARKIRVSNCKP